MSSVNKISKKSFKKFNKWIFISIIFIFIAGIATFSVYYYFNVYLQPNFSDRSLNFVSTGNNEFVKPGEKITYTIKFENTGIRTVDELEIVTKIPENSEFISADKEGNVNEEEGKLEFVIKNDIKKGDKGSVEFIVGVNKPLDNGTPIILDQVVFNYKIKEEKYSEIINAGLNHKVKSAPEFGNFDVEFVDENGGYLRLGDEISYTLKVENTGDMNAAGVEIKSTLSDNVTIVEDSINNSGTYKDGIVIWNVGELEINKQNIFLFKAIVNDNLSDGELIANNSIITCKQNVKAEKAVENKVSLFSDLSNSEAFLYDVNGGYLWAGETVSVKIIVKNTGEKIAESYKLICPTPGGATYVSKSGTSEGIRWSDEIRGLIWDLKDLKVGEQKEITFNLRVNDDLLYKGGTITTNFKIEIDSKEIEIPSKSITVKGRVNMTIVAMGDSLIALSDWVQRFDNLLESTYPYADYNTIASGVGGERTYQGYWRFDSTIAPYHPGIIIIAYGSNDAGSGLWNFRDNLDAIVAKSKNLGATVFINLIGPIVPPRLGGKESYPEYNDEIRRIASKYGVHVIDVLTPLSQDPNRYLRDGLHYSPEGSAVVAQTVFNAVTQYLDDVGGRR